MSYICRKPLKTAATQNAACIPRVMRAATISFSHVFPCHAVHSWDSPASTAKRFPASPFVSPSCFATRPTRDHSTIATASACRNLNQLCGQ